MKTWTLTGIPALDTVLSFVISGAAGILIVLVLIKSIKFYNQGNYPQLAINIVIGVLLVAVLLGPETIKGLATEMSEFLPKGSGGGTAPVGGGSGK